MSVVLYSSGSQSGRCTYDQWALVVLFVLLEEKDIDAESRCGVEEGKDSNGDEELSWRGVVANEEEALFVPGFTGGGVKIHLVESDRSELWFSLSFKYSLMVKLNFRPKLFCSICTDQHEMPSQRMNPFFTDYLEVLLFTLTVPRSFLSLLIQSIFYRPHIHIFYLFHLEGIIQILNFQCSAFNDITYVSH